MTLRVYGLAVLLLAGLACSESTVVVGTRSGDPSPDGSAAPQDAGLRDDAGRDAGGTFPRVCESSDCEGLPDGFRDCRDGARYTGRCVDLGSGCALEQVECDPDADGGMFPPDPFDAGTGEGSGSAE